MLGLDFYPKSLYASLPNAQYIVGCAKTIPRHYNEHSQGRLSQRGAHFKGTEGFK